jgi:parvulin-like peptidyl-prolyl isomerase
MHNKKRSFLLLALAMIMLLTGCKLVVRDEALYQQIQNNAVVAEIYGEPITRGEAQLEYAYMESQYAYLYQMFGMSADPSDPSFIAIVKEATVDSIADRRIFEHEAASRGIALTQEELDAIKTQAQEEFDASIASEVEYLKANGSEESDEKLTTLVVDYYALIGNTVAALEASYKTEKLRGLLEEDATKEVTVSEEDTRAEYDSLVESKKTAYETTPTQFATDANSASATLYYRPSGFRYAKHVFIPYADEVNTAISDANAKITTNNTAKTSLETELSSLEDTAENDERRAELAELIAGLDEDNAAQSEIIAAQRQIGIDALTPSAQEVAEQATAEGASFDDIMTQYNKDALFTSDKAKANGIAVSADSSNMTEAYRTAALSLANVGDVSEPVATDTGLYVIKYESEIEEGQIPYDDVKEAIHADLLSAKKSETFTSLMEQWRVDAKYTKYIDKWVD